MFLELLESEIFTALNLATPWPKCKKVRLGESVTQTFLDELSVLDLDNLPVWDGRVVLGYAKADSLHPGDVVSRRHVHRILERCTVRPATHFRELAERIRSDGMRDYNFYFIQDNGGIPKGILTYADFNRRTVYIYCYVMLNFLEQWIKKLIMEKYEEPNRTLSPLWMSSLGEKRKQELINEAKGRGQTAMGVADLEDLIQVLTLDLEPSMTNNRRRMLNAARAIRTGVSHPVKLLIPRGDSGALRQLIWFWKEMIPLVQANDVNWKNGGWPLHQA